MKKLINILPSYIMHKLTKLQIILVVFLLSGSINIANSGDVAPDDKKWHFAAGNQEADMLRSLGLSYWERILAVWATAELKEHVDVNCGGKRDSGDVLATVLGASIKLDYTIKF